MIRLKHYVVVRRDLPLGVLAVNVAHAAGESFYELGERTELYIRPEDRPFDPQRTAAIVLGARNENRLKWLRRKLEEAKVEYVAIVEPDEGPYKDQLMAIGLLPLPGDGRRLEILNDFYMLGSVAPTVEHAPRKAVVVGSNPTRASNDV